METRRFRATMRHVTLLGLGMLGGVGLGYHLGGIWAPTGESGDVTERRESGFSLVNPLIDCELLRHSPRNRILQPFRDQVEGYLRLSRDSGQISEAGVYFRDLSNGPWFSIGYQEHFVPASLLKVPAMMALFRQSEGQPGLLEARVLYHPSEDLNARERVRPSIVLEPGREYSVDELVRAMIVHSDNNAASLLLELMERSLEDELYDHMGVGFHTEEGEGRLAIEEYASFFRVLYNSSYLTRKMSEKALRLLTESDYREGLVAGVPPGTVVAHKFGERELAQEGPDREQLHDCGIVYFPNRPYLLCVMTRGPEFEALDDVIAGVSSIVYREIARQRAADGP